MADPGEISRFSAISVYQAQARIAMAGDSFTATRPGGRLYFLIADREVTRTIASSTSSLVMWAGGLGLPMLLGVRYLYLLFSRAAKIESRMTSGYG